MSHISTTHDLFFNQTEMDRAAAQRQIKDGLHGSDDGELYFEYRQSEGIVLDDGKIKSAAFDTTQGFGLRAVSGETTGYSHASNLTDEALTRACQTVAAVKSGNGGTLSQGPAPTNRLLYSDENPLSNIQFESKVDLLEQIDAYVRAKDERVRQVTASLSGEWQAVLIMRGDGSEHADIRPLVRMNVSVVIEQNGRMESGSFGTGGRSDYQPFIEPAEWKKAADEALRQAVVNLSSEPAPAGEMTVVLGAGWPGILLHEAIGHGLEGDFNRKGTSAFSGLIGEQVAAKGITVVDDATIEGRRGSLTVDDEGTPGENTVLIEDGILKGYMQDRMNARLMGQSSTGNGRRQSYAHAPMPRMTNTYMLNGQYDPDEIIQSVDKGIYAVNFGGGQVDITSGNFVFSCTEAYTLENGKIGQPLKGATLIGLGPEVLKNVTMLGNDMALDPGIGTCGKDGQGVPVGVGQPTLRVENMTVGGTQTG